MPLNLRERAYSFRHAIRGIGIVIRTQPNAWIHLAATLGVVIAGKLLNVSRGEWLALVLAIGLVWTAEALNTAIEFLADEISLERRDRLGLAKDTGAAGVLLAAIATAIIGSSSSCRISSRSRNGSRPRPHSILKGLYLSAQGWRFSAYPG